ncbi:hypothetical protein CYLTODRAFT_348250, partial [Cylindrobasidium torrendii FP15055 ss-10]
MVSAEPQDTVPDQLTIAYWNASHAPPTTTVDIDPKLRDEWVSAYKEDQEFKSVYQEAPQWENWKAGQRFLRSQDGMLFFRDADFHSRLCVPMAFRTSLLTLLHEDPMETAH